MTNLFSGACSSYHILVPKLFILFSGAPSYFNYHFKAPSNSSQALNLIPFIFHFPCFHYRSSSWWFIMFLFILEVFIKILVGAQAFFIMHSNCNPFYLIFSDGVMSFLTNSFMFHDSQVIRNDIFNPVNFFVGVILGCISPKAFPKDCCYLWCL